MTTKHIHGFVQAIKIGRLFFASVRPCRRVVILALAGCTLFALDKVRVETRVDDSIRKFGVSGKGVIYAMLDRGIDWQNSDFRNPVSAKAIA